MVHVVRQRWSNFERLEYFMKGYNRWPKNPTFFLHTLILWKCLSSIAGDMLRDFSLARHRSSREYIGIFGNIKGNF